MRHYLATHALPAGPGLDPERVDEAMRRAAQAEGIIDTRFPQTRRRVETGKLSRGVVEAVVIDMVARYLDSEDRGGLSKLSYPEASMEWESGGMGQGNSLWLTLDEVKLLTPPASRKVGSVRWRAKPVLPDSVVR